VEGAHQQGQKAPPVGIHDLELCIFADSTTDEFLAPATCSRWAGYLIPLFLHHVTMKACGTAPGESESDSACHHARGFSKGSRLLPNPSYPASHKLLASISAAVFWVTNRSTPPGSWPVIKREGGRGGVEVLALLLGLWQDLHENL